MAEFQSSRPTHLQAMLEPRIYNIHCIYIYTYNSHCNIVILVGLHMLVARAKYNILNVIKI